MNDATFNRGVLVTGAAGFIGSALLLALADDGHEQITALDLRDVPPAKQRAGIGYEHGDIRDPALKDIIARVRPRTVVHLASVVAVGGTNGATMRSTCSARAMSWKPVWPPVSNT